ncbi:relaxase/mobilization nuclease domain-containing protein [Aliivibrio sp. S4TY2]|uniref:Type IV secretion system protein VirD2 n=1 Tax=Aliivibrio finisterrensis TaxID=511998 RepID=A0A4Q5KXU2_9GAMM|nr:MULTISPECIES: relaxase/mobilization nuclease domain-containing protein [Aliivibrio]MDD9156282.1 relaxase/mobilization nuclease domain-containing protein [Aliivibrio sp. S4TY2]MDD9160629.1 relaxase/mobilization nuclease domain-containing protein [Aliivibrio sp. S4TY1]MDD9163989.1 relaxase/mobilization nuclease domain-containing protein [Aliivibrio sp. S4MY2]MDD9168036.1 relaxase/mobilization nuclease domain-containing protein [Aliivibrio sp. S4MY4]MDD9177179.1 relaxase/mobilization nuclease 
MIYKEPDQKGGKHSASTAETLVNYIAGDDERVAKYLVQYVKGDTKEAGAVTEFICANNILNIPENARSASGEDLDMSAAIREMQDSIKLNPNAKQQFKHMIVSLDTDEHLSKAQWRKTVRKLMSYLGYDNCRYIAFKHNDTDEQHVHIVTSTIDTITRKRVRDSYSKIRAQEVMRELEKEFGLRELVSSKDIGYDVKAEINDASIFNKKAQIARLVKQGINKLTEGSTLADFVVAVESTHTDLKVEIQRKGNTATGLVFNLNEIRMSASQLGGNRKYTLGKLIGSGILDKECRCLDNHEEELERAAKHAQKQLLDATAAADDKRDEDNRITLIKFSASARHAKEVNNLISDMRLAMRARRASRGASDVAYVVEVRSALKDLGGSIGNIAEAIIEHLLYQLLENKEKVYAERMQKTYNSTIVEEISETEYKNFTANAYTEILNKDSKNKKDKVYNAFGSVIDKELHIHN